MQLSYVYETLLDNKLKQERLMPRLKESCLRKKVITDSITISETWAKEIVADMYCRYGSAYKVVRRLRNYLQKGVG